jgi:hypothetical protein
MLSIGLFNLCFSSICGVYELILQKIQIELKWNCAPCCDTLNSKCRKPACQCNRTERFKEWIYFLVCGWKYPSEKKWRETASLRVAHDAKFPSFFFRIDTPSTNKTNNFIPYHSIISKHKYYGIKHCIFHDLLLCDVWVFYDVVLCHRSMDTKIEQIFQPIKW